MKKQMLCLAILFTSIVLIASACGTAGVPAAPGAAVSTGPGGASVKVVEHSAIPSVVYLDAESPIQPESGNQYYAVAVKFEAGASPYTSMLNLDNVKLTAKDGAIYAPVTLTIGPGEGDKITDMAFFRNVGKGDRTLDFGFGFVGNDMTMTVAYAEGKRDSLTIYHGDTPTRMIFLFQIPAKAVPAALEVPEFPQMTLE